MEQFKPIKGYEGLYEVSSFGRVRSLRRKDRLNRQITTKILYIKKHRDGYLQVSLSKDGKYNYLYIHRLVGKHFISNPQNKKFINHKDGNKKNNFVGNLEWCTKSENMIHATILVPNYAERRSKLTSIQVREIRRMLAMGKSQAEIGRHFGVGQTTISRIKHKKRWSHLV